MSALRTARRERGWSQTALARRLQIAAQRAGTPVASLESLKTQISRWENGKVQPDALYRSLLRGLTGLSDEALEFLPDDSEGRAHLTFEEQLASAEAATPEVVDGVE